MLCSTASCNLRQVKVSIHQCMWRLEKHEAVSSRHFVALYRNSRAWILGVDVCAVSKMDICKSTDEKSGGANSRYRKQSNQYASKPKRKIPPICNTAHNVAIQFVIQTAPRLLHSALTPPGALSVPTPPVVVFQKGPAWPQ